MKKYGFAAAALASVLSLTLMACGGSNTSEQTATEAASEETVVEEAVTGGEAANAASEATTQLGDPFVGHPISEFDISVLTDSDETTTLSAIANGKPLVVNLWATWCPYCVEELPAFQELYHEFGDKMSFAFVDLVDGNVETQDIARTFLQENNLQDLPVYYDTENASYEPFKADGIPMTIVFDANGNLVDRIVGVISADEVHGLFESVTA